MGAQTAKSEQLCWEQQGLDDAFKHEVEWGDSGSGCTWSILTRRVMGSRKCREQGAWSLWVCGCLWGSAVCVLIDLCRHFELPSSGFLPARVERAGSAWLFQVQPKVYAT